MKQFQNSNDNPIYINSSIYKSLHVFITNKIYSYIFKLATYMDVYISASMLIMRYNSISLNYLHK